MDEENLTIGATNYLYCGFEEMLLDEDRNLKYRRAIEKVVSEKLQKGEKVHLLDIGSGTGLLSFYGVKAGATFVTAVEVDPVVFEISKKIAKQAGLAHRINFINANSLDIDDLSQKANVLVTEIFDSEMLGENALRTFRHALENLTTPDVICIPARADIFVVPIESWLLSQHCRPPKCLQVPCLGNLHGIDSHWSTSGRKTYNFACKQSLLLKSFTFNNVDSLSLKDARSVNFTVNERINQIDGILLWWDLDLLDNSTCIITTGTEKDKPRWRNHWLQVAYGFSTPVPTRLGYEFELVGCHDEVSFWFDIYQRINLETIVTPERRNCTCGWHLTVSFETILRWNTEYLESQFVKTAIKESMNLKVLCIGSQTLMPTVLKAKQIVVIEPNKRFWDQIGPHCIKAVSFIDRVSQIGCWNNIDYVIFDMHSHDYPTLSKFAAIYCEVVSQCPSVQILPQQLELHAMPVKFANLWKRRMRVNRIHEIDYTEFDLSFGHKGQMNSDDIEELPLWEEPCIIRAQPKKVLSYNPPMTGNPPPLKLSIPVNTDAFVFYFTCKHKGVQLYRPFHQFEQKIEWFKGTRQWVYFLSQDDSTSLEIQFVNPSEQHFIVSDNLDLELLGFAKTGPAGVPRSKKRRFT